MVCIWFVAKFSLFVEDTPYHVALREALKPIREPVNCGEVARHPTSTRIRQSGYGQNPASGQKQITRREHHQHKLVLSDGIVYVSTIAAALGKHAR